MVVGLGGFVLRSAQPEVLAQWYRDMLGIDLVRTSADQQPWMTEGGAVVLAPFAQDISYLAADKAFMLNFKVRDLAAMVAQLETAGVEVKPLPEMSGIGKFAHLTDPEGTPIELWEPA